MLKQVLLFWLVSFVSLCCDAEKLQFASIDGLVEQEVGRIVIPEVYKKLNIDVSIIPLPAQQAQKNARSGRYAGEIMRIWSYGEESNEVVRVPSPYYFLETMAFYKSNSGVIIHSKADLSHYRILKILGVKHTENITAGLSNVVDIDSVEKMMKLLEYGRADIALTNTINGQIAIDKLGIDDIEHLPKPLDVLNLYHYIHKSHCELVPKVDAVIKEMQASGELQKLIKRAEKSVIENRKL